MTQLPRKHPPHLLTAPLGDRLHYLQRELVLSHHRLESLAQDLKAGISYPTDRNLILLVGPTGVGKSALLRYLSRKCNEEVGSLDGSPALGGGVYVELAAPKRGRFEFRQLHVKVMEALGTLLPEKSRPLVLREAGTLSLQTLLLERKSPELTVRGIDERFKKEVVNHRLRAVICDEGRSIFKIGSTSREARRMELLKEQGDILKDMANELHTTFVLGGAYDFFDVAITSGQTARRSRVVHFTPYDLAHELEHYVDAAIGLLAHVPIDLQLDPDQAVHELASQSLGCIGTTNGILGEAMKTAYSKSEPLSIDVLRTHYYPAAALRTMQKEQADGMASVSAFLTLGDVIKGEGGSTDPAAREPAQSAGKRHKPGDTTPSRRAGDNRAW